MKIQLSILKTVFNPFVAGVKNIHRHIGANMLAGFTVLVAFALIAGAFYLNFWFGVIFAIVLGIGVYSFLTVFLIRYGLNILRGAKQHGGVIKAYKDSFRNLKSLLTYPITLGLVTLIIALVWFVTKFADLAIFSALQEIALKDFVSDLSISEVLTKYALYALLFFVQIFAMVFPAVFGIYWIPVAAVDKNLGPIAATTYTWKLFKGNRIRVAVASTLISLMTLILVALSVLLPVIIFGGAITISSVLNPSALLDNLLVAFILAAFILQFIVAPIIALTGLSIYTGLVGKSDSPASYEQQASTADRVDFTHIKDGAVKLYTFAKTKAQDAIIAFRSLSRKTKKNILFGAITVLALTVAFPLINGYIKSKNNYTKIQPSNQAIEEIGKEKALSYVEELEESGDTIKIIGRDLVYTYNGKLFVKKGSDCACDMEAIEKYISDPNCKEEHSFDSPRDFGDYIYVGYSGYPCTATMPYHENIFIKKSDTSILKSVSILAIMSYLKEQGDFGDSKPLDDSYIQSFSLAPQLVEIKDDVIIVALWKLHDGNYLAESRASGEFYIETSVGDYMDNFIASDDEFSKIGTKVGVKKVRLSDIQRFSESMRE